MNPEVSFNVKQIDDFNFTVDVDLNNVPKNFLGTAFHLKLNGIKWRLDNYVLGCALRAPDRRMILIGTKKSTADCKTADTNSSAAPDTTSTIVASGGNTLPNKLDSEIIFGFSNNFGEQSIVSNGNLVTFQIQLCSKTKLKQGTMITPVVSKQVYSVINGQSRQDQADVKWSAQSLNVGKTVVAASNGSDSTNSTQNDQYLGTNQYGDADLSTIGTLQTNQTDQIVALNGQDSVLANGLEYSYLMVLLVGALFITGIGYVLYRWLR